MVLDEEDRATNDLGFPSHEIDAGKLPPVLQVAAPLRIVARSIAGDELGAWSAIRKRSISSRQSRCARRPSVGVDASAAAAAERSRTACFTVQAGPVDLPAGQDVNDLHRADPAVLAGRVRPFLEPEPLVPIADALADDELLAYAHEHGLF
jgi:hypothetical protein